MNVVDLLFVPALIATLVVASVSDLRTRRVPNAVVALMAGLGLARALWCGAFSGRVPAALGKAVAGALVVALPLMVVGLLYERLRQAPGIGGADIKMLAATAVWCGPLAGLAVVAASCALGLLGWALAGAVRRILWAMSGHKAVMFEPGATVRGIPMAPAISLASIIAVLFTAY